MQSRVEAEEKFESSKSYTPIPAAIAVCFAMISAFEKLKFKKKFKGISLRNIFLMNCNLDLFDSSNSCR